jgi:hypothetical protein
MNNTTKVLPALVAAMAFSPMIHAADKPLGYQDTPLIPGTQWHVHDGTRPQPPVVTPGEFSTQEKVGTAPSDAVVLFDGKDLSQWRTGNGGEAGWKVENGYAEVVPKSGDIFTKQEFGPDVQIHIEFATPPPQGDGQGRGNSGIFLFGRYEIQILDSYNNPTYPDGQATAIYGFMPPLVNASRPPGQWQVYDIVFTAPKLKDGKVVEPACITTFVNGVCVQNHTKIMGPTKHKQVTNYDGDFPEKAPIRIQDHKNDPPVRVRNIWLRPLP